MRLGTFVIGYFFEKKRNPFNERYFRWECSRFCRFFLNGYISATTLEGLLGAIQLDQWGIEHINIDGGKFTFVLLSRYRVWLRAISQI